MGAGGRSSSNTRATGPSSSESQDNVVEMRGTSFKDNEKVGTSRFFSQWEDILLLKHFNRT